MSKIFIFLLLIKSQKNNLIWGNLTFLQLFLKTKNNKKKIVTVRQQITFISISWLKFAITSGFSDFFESVVQTTKILSPVLVPIELTKLKNEFTILLLNSFISFSLNKNWNLKKKIKNLLNFSLKLILLI